MNCLFNFHTKIITWTQKIHKVCYNTSNRLLAPRLMHIYSTARLAVSCSSSVLASINEVNLCRARLVLGWVITGLLYCFTVTCERHKKRDAVSSVSESTAQKYHRRPSDSYSLISAEKFRNKSILYCITGISSPYEMRKLKIWLSAKITELACLMY